MRQGSKPSEASPSDTLPLARLHLLKASQPPQTVPPAEDPAIQVPEPLGNIWTQSTTQKSSNLNVIPGTHMKLEGENRLQSCPPTFMCMPIHMYI